MSRNNSKFDLLFQNAVLDEFKIMYFSRKLMEVSTPPTVDSLSYVVVFFIFILLMTPSLQRPNV